MPQPFVSKECSVTVLLAMTLDFSYASDSHCSILPCSKTQHTEALKSNQ